MIKRLLLLAGLFCSTVHSQIILNFDNESFDDSELSNPYVYNGYKFTMTPDGRHPDYNDTNSAIKRDSIVGDNLSKGDTGLNSLRLFRDSSQIINFVVESVGGEEFNLDGFYFDGDYELFEGFVIKTNITSVEAYKDGVLQGTQTTGFSLTGTQSLNSFFDDVDQVKINVQSDSSLVYLYLDTFTIGSSPTLFASETKEAALKDVRVENSSFVTDVTGASLDVYNLLGQLIKNNNLLPGIYVVVFQDKEGNMSAVKKAI